MSQTPESSDNLSPLKRAILEMREMRTRISHLEGQMQQPIAIVGAGMRIPGGANDEASLWQLLANGVDAVTEIPTERWDLQTYYDADPDAPGKMYSRHGAFLREVDLFDSEFFGVSPREAASMDPQQRLLQEVAWEALENAAVAPAGLAGSPTGVFLGYGNSDYWRMVYSDEKAIDAYSALGCSYSVAAGRLSYLLGLHGPSLTVDTACSASLVAVHLACQSLRAGECTLALAGGVNLILSPEANINFSKSRMLAPDGRCKTFDAAADGYVRGEGCGIIVLKPLAAAQADGNRILAVIRGTAINQDGRSAGLTAPNGPAQESVLKTALQNAGVAPHEVSYLEAHGTGTSLGDPIEIRAASAVLCKDRPASQPLTIGTIKTNVGHLEAAAGVAGLLKVIASLRQKQIPPHLHLKQATSHIDWQRTPLVIPTTLTPWQPINGRRIAGVSSFGFSGTNAHVILEEAPETPPTPAPSGDRPLHLLALSAKDTGALRQLASAHAANLATDPAPAIADACFSAAVGRSHFAHRLAITGASAGEIRAGLDQFLAGGQSAALATGHALDPRQPPVAFLFTGQGSQYAGMARGLYQTSPEFRQTLDQCAEILRPLLPQPLLDVVFPAPGAAPLLDQTLYTQPALFAVEYALAQLWRSWGVHPTFVMGHSVGEYVAACVAGVFSLEDGLKLIAERARLMQALPAGGRMAAIFATPERVADVIQGHADISIAAVNGPESVVVSGSGASVDAVLHELSRAGIKSKALVVSHAFHSPLMDPMLAEFERFASGITFAEPHIGLISNVTGGIAGSSLVTNAAYWRRHVREPVQFAAAVRALEKEGVRHFLEIGPTPVLLGMAQRCVSDDRCQWLPSLRSGRDDWQQMIASVQALYTSGCNLDWSGWDRHAARSRVALPTYAFQRRRHWIERPGAATRAAAMHPDRTWQAAKAAALRQSRAAPLGMNVASYAEKWEALAALATAHAAHTLREVGAFAQRDEAHDANSLIAQYGIPAMYHHLVHRWLERLAAAGWLRAASGRFVADQPLPTTVLAGATARAYGLLADDPHLLAYLRNCGEKLTAVMRGQESPLETLFPGGSPTLAERLYDGANPNRYMNAIAGAAIEGVSRAWTASRPLRILEVGAGTGGTTSTLLPALDPATSAYLFTDVSDMFLGRAREKFGHYTIARFGVFDLEKDIAAQGFEPHSFDIIVGANVVHAARDLDGALKRIRSLLTPGGFLLLAEATRHHDWFDFTTGLIEGWQHFADDLRGDNPLLTPRVWQGALLERGFSEVAWYPEDGSSAEVLAQHVIIARTPPAEGETSAIGSTPFMPGEAATGPAPAAAAAVSADEVQALRERIRGAIADEQMDVMLEYVRDRVMRVLRLDADRRPDFRHRLMDLGLDSLMAVQLRNVLETGLGLSRTLPATIMFDYPTIEAIASFLLKHVVEPAAPATAPVPTSPAASDRAREIEALSDDEAAALLLKRLERK